MGKTTLDSVKHAELEQIVLYDERVMRVIGIGDGRSVTLREVGGSECPSCGMMPDVHLLEDSPLFQKQVRPVPTIGLT